MFITKGATDVTTYFHLRLTADGTDATGLTITNIDLQYTRSGATPAAKVDATALAATNSAHGDNQAIEVDATDQPGLYRVDWPDAAFATGVDFVYLTVKCATVFTETLRVQLLSATRGLAGTALPDAAADAAGGLPISDAGGLDLDAQIGTDIDAILVDTGTTLDGNITSILADTNELQTDWANGGRLDLLIDAILADTNELQTDWANGGRLDLLIDAILADTNELQTDWADGGRLDLILDARASQASVDAVDDFLDTEIAAILAAVDTEVAAIKTKTDSLTFTVAGVVDANVQRINDVTVNGDGSATPWGP